MQACRLHFIKARKWAHESGSNIRAFGCEKAVKDDNKSCNNNGDEDLVAYFEAFDKLLNNDNFDNNNYDHNASKCNCCDQSDSMASDKEEGKCKKPEEVVYRKGICHKKEHGISVVESRLVHSESRDMAGMQSCAQISSLRETNKSEEMCEIREDSTCSFNETQQKPILDCDKKQKKSVSKKTSASLLSFEKKRLEVEHERLELEKKKFEWQQEKEGRELKLKQTELERMFELKKCELAKEERIEKEKIKLQLEHEARLKEYEMEMKTRQNRSTTSLTILVKTSSKPTYKSNLLKLLMDVKFLNCISKLTVKVNSSQPALTGHSIPLPRTTHSLLKTCLIFCRQPKSVK
uniref:Uncharacterized protein n=1 Tax=Glossina pallidipes TaxID=7398 RepID=A0A1A9ZWV4_GLOPL